MFIWPCRAPLTVKEPGPVLEERALDSDEEELKKALALSRQDMEVEDEEADLRRAIQLSMQGERKMFCHHYTESSFAHGNT